MNISRWILRWIWYQAAIFSPRCMTNLNEPSENIADRCIVLRNARDHVLRKWKDLQLRRDETEMNVNLLSRIPRTDSTKRRVYISREQVRASVLICGEKNGAKITRNLSQACVSRSVKVERISVNYCYTLRHLCAIRKLREIGFSSLAKNPAEPDHRYFCAGPFLQWDFSAAQSE